MHDSPIVELYSAADSAEAYTVKNLLEQQDISSRIVGEWLQNALGDIPLGTATAPRIWVSRDDAARAQEVLAEFLAIRHQAAPSDEEAPRPNDWKCPGCGEEVTSDFDVCWNCEYDRVPHHPDAEASFT